MTINNICCNVEVSTSLNSTITMTNGLMTKEKVSDKKNSALIKPISRKKKIDVLTIISSTFKKLSLVVIKLDCFVINIIS